MKQNVFARCDRCIGLKPCTEMKDGKVICDLCGNQVRMEKEHEHSLDYQTQVVEQRI